MKSLIEFIKESNNELEKVYAFNFMDVSYKDREDVEDRIYSLFDHLDSEIIRRKRINLPEDDSLKVDIMMKNKTEQVDYTKDYKKISKEIYDIISKNFTDKETGIILEYHETDKVIDKLVFSVLYDTKYLKDLKKFRDPKYIWRIKGEEISDAYDRKEWQGD
ncbi:MAG: hypothetical protein J1F35_06335 [Erysipelotrichales bacterium]|nr:hypothetical protein [Erysipelotrichales bacterium]